MHQVRSDGSLRKEGVIAMEERNGNQKNSATILLLVGVLFIIVSGGIFVSSSWQYIPDVLKRCFLAVLTAGFFLSSGFVEKKWELSRTSQGLYYLGVAFLGFTVYALSWYFDMEVWGRVLAAQCGMSLAVTRRFLTGRKAQDGILQMILLDGMAVSLSFLWSGRWAEILVLTASVITVFHSIILRAYLEEGERTGSPSNPAAAPFLRWPEAFRALVSGGQRGAGTAAAVFYVLHLVYAGLFTFWVVLADDVLLPFRLVPVLLLLLSVTILYDARRTKGLRWTQSFFLHFTCFALAVFLTRILCEHVSEELISSFWWIWFLLSLTASFLMKRKEMFLAVMMANVLGSFGNLFFLSLDAAFGAESKLGFPYAFAMAAAVLVWEAYIGFGLKKKTVGKIAALWGLAFLNQCLAVMPAEAFREAYLGDYAHSVLWALNLLILANLLEGSYGASGAFRTLAMAVCFRVLWDNPVFDTVIRTEEGDRIVNFTTEYTCVLLALCIALLGKIWYHKGKGLRRFQFSAACGLLAVLVMENVSSGNVFNVLFLAVSALVMLVTATICGSRRYSIASAVTLAFTALYLTRGIWTNVAWWVYLFVAGVGLVVYAVKKEKADKE